MVLSILCIEVQEFIGNSTISHRKIEEKREVTGDSAAISEKQLKSPGKQLETW